MSKSVPPMTLILFALSIGNLNADETETEYLSNCQEQVYKNLILKNQVGAALLMKFSNAIPTECKIQYDLLKRKQILDDPRYVSEVYPDSQYRKIVDSSLRLDNADQKIGDRVLEQIERYDQIQAKETKVPNDAVRGYSVITGHKKNPR